MAIINSRPGTSRLSAALNAVKMLAVLLLLLSLPIRPARADLTPAVLDTGFDPGTGANNSVYATAVQHDGKVVIGGMFTQVDGTTRNYVARLDADGSLDTTFDPGTGPNNWVLSAAPRMMERSLSGAIFPLWMARRATASPG